MAASSSEQSLPVGISSRLSAEQLWMTRLCLSIMGGLGLASWIGVASSLYLLSEAPLLLIALSPIGRHLLLVAPISHPVAFVSVAVTRRLIFYATSYELGRAVGPDGLVWLEGKARWFARFVRFLERIFAWSPYLVGFFALGPIVSCIAGMTGMGRSVFLLLAGTGLTFRMALTVVLAEWMREPLEAVLSLLREYRGPGTAVLVSALVIQHFWQRRTRRRLADG